MVQDEMWAAMGHPCGLTSLPLVLQRHPEYGRELQDLPRVLTASAPANQRTAAA
jgi:hypothetical protein